MAVTATPIFPQTITNKTLTLNNGSGTTVTNLYAAGTNGSKVEMLLASSTDTSARDVSVYLVISGTNYLLGTVSVPATAGSVNNVATINLLNSSNFPGLPKDANGNPYIYLGNGTTLAIGALTTVTSGKQLQFAAHGGDY